MKTIELFSGTKSFSKVMAKHGHDTFTVDDDVSLMPDLVCDILKLDIKKLSHANSPDMLWASPPCQGFSVAAMGRNWNIDNTPKTDSARLAMALAQKTLELITTLKPKWWFIENPRGKLRKMSFMQGLIRHTVTYCQYGDTRMKPTDIWTNATWWHPRDKCSPGASCHEAAPRGSRTGTQGLNGAKDRGVIPPQIFEEILNQMP